MTDYAARQARKPTRLVAIDCKQPYAAPCIYSFDTQYTCHYAFVVFYTFPPPKMHSIFARRTNDMTNADNAMRYIFWYEHDNSAIALLKAQTYGQSDVDSISQDESVVGPFFALHTPC